MRIIQSLTLALFLAACSVAFGQETSDLFEKAPPPIDEALRARVKQFYDSYMAGKFREAYALVADDSQDAYMESAKDTYKDCQTVKINYSENFTRAAVLETCKSEWRWHGQSIPTTLPMSTNWKLVNGQWYWSFVKPKFAANPFSPTGFTRIPDDQQAGAATSNLPKIPDAKDILTKVKIDKTEIKLHSYETSRDELHVRNEMPGTISFSIDPLPLPGLKIIAPKTQLNANEETTVIIEYQLEDATITCGECAKRVKGTMTTHLRVQPTSQLFPINITFTPPPDDGGKP